MEANRSGVNDQTMALHGWRDALRQSFRQQAFPPLDERLARLQALARLTLDNQAALADAVSADFGRRSVVETKLLELFRHWGRYVMPGATCRAG